MRYLVILLCSFFTLPLLGQIKVVILGSSTAVGIGVSHPDSAWVNRYRSYLENQEANIEVINLAKGGYTTFHILPTGTETPTNRPRPEISRNITAGLNENPDAIIINLPSNDAKKGYLVSEQLANYDVILDQAKNASVPVWVATPQGRNLNSAGRQNLKDMRDSTYARYGEKAIDFWTHIGQSNGTLNIINDSGDGVHLNDRGHKILFNRVVEKDIIKAILTDVQTILISKPRLRIFPNPAAQILFISFEKELQEKTEIRIIDISGKELDSYFIDKNNSDLEVNIQGLESGVYQLIFFDKKSVWSEIFIKK